MGETLTPMHALTLELQRILHAIILSQVRRPPTRPVPVDVDEPSTLRLAHMARHGIKRSPGAQGCVA